MKEAAEMVKGKLTVFKGKINDFMIRKRYVSGITAIEMVLILVVLIALVLIFQEELKDLIGKIFDKIKSGNNEITLS